MNKFNQIVNQIQNETPTAAESAEAARRVHQTLFGPGSATPGELHSCNDFRALFAAYLQKTLPDARRMLLEDHIRECVHCRKALEEDRNPKIRPLVFPGSRQTVAPKWAIAAAVLVTVGAAAFAARNYLPFLDSSPRASVQSVNGMLYRLSNTGSLPIGESAELKDGEEVRTPAGARAVVALWDGSRVEMNERAQLSVTRSWRGTTIHLERGHVIVQAARQKRGKLFVSTVDSEVAVVGTIFSVNQGSQGARVSVVEGNVEVRQNGRTENLKPGDQSTSNTALGKVPVEAEISWSQDAVRYAALLGELNILQRRLEAVPAQGLRYQSRLLVYTPEDSKFYLAIPNMGVTLVEAKRIFDERVRFSEVLRQWWEAPENRRMKTEVEFLIDQLKELSTYLGDEIVVSVNGTSTPSAVLLAEVKSPGITQFLDRLLREKGGSQPAFSYGVQNNILVITDTPARLQQAQAVIARGGAPSTPFRQRIEQSYRNGAGWLMCANMEQIVQGNVLSKKEPSITDLGFNNAQYVVAERRDIAGKTENRATLTFSGARHGVASWIAAPGPMSTLNFVSPDAGAAFSIVVKQPRAMLEEMLQMASRGSATPANDLAKFEQATGLKVLDDLAAPLGSEMTFAIDGPVLPVPSWKLALEVNAPQRLQTSIEKLVAAAATLDSQTKWTLVSETVNQRTFYKLTVSSLPIAEIHYTYVDSYLLMAANRTLLTQAIQNRQMGLTLPRSDKFRSQLPYATNPNFSAVLYHSLGTMLSPVIDSLQLLVNPPAAMQQSMQAVKDSQPGVIGAYAEADRISIASTGNFFGLNLGMFAGPAGLMRQLKQ